MHLSKTVGYAIGALAQLAAYDGAKPLSCREICNRTNMPERFVLTILRTLARAGVVDSTRGIKGGYQLAKPPSRITLLEICDAVDGLPGPPALKLNGLSTSGQQVMDEAFLGIADNSRRRLNAFRLDELQVGSS